MKFRLVHLLCMCFVVVRAYKSYSGYQVISVTITSAQDAADIRRLAQDSRDFDVWKGGHRPGDDMVVMVTPRAARDFIAALEERRFDYTIRDVDIGRKVKKQMSTEGNPAEYTAYRDLAGMEAWIDEMAANFSSVVTIFTAGQSYEGRNIRGIKMSTGGTGKPAVWVDSCIHSREWMACASNTYQMQKLMENYGVDDDVTMFLGAIDLYVVPVFNVDGYEYTHTTDRLWRKSRSLNPGNPDPDCAGTDLNRNWNYHHCEKGSSLDPCTNTYCGSGPFSEVETATVSSYLSTIPNLQMFVTLHSYGYWWMSVYAYSEERPANNCRAMEICVDVVAAIARVDGYYFECGRISSFVGETSGSSVDWVKDYLGVKYCYGAELRGDNFIVPEEEIIPSGEENYAGLLQLLRAIYEENA